MIKLIKTINSNSSAYAGSKRSFTEWYLRPSPKTDENGNELPPNKRYAVVRFLNFEHGDRTDYPFIQRNEHICLKKDSDGKIVSIDKIVCPSTAWAKNKLYQQGEKIGKGYCPICDYSYEKNKEAWRIPGQVDRTSARLSTETKSVWTVYMPVYVVSDPHYPNNNQHLRVLRLVGDTGKAALEKITTVLNDLTERGINAYNGEMGVNIGLLCESVKKTKMNRKGEVSIDKKTGKPYTYTVSEITDIRPMVKKQYAYPDITDAAIEELDFDGTYGVPATRVELMDFLNRNWLDIGGGESDFGGLSNSEFATDESNDSEATQPVDTSIAKQTVSTEADDDEVADAFEPSTPQQQSNSVESSSSDDEDTADSLISGILGNSPVTSQSVKKTVQPNVGANQLSKTTAKVIPPNVEEVREAAAIGSADLDDLPF